MALLGVGPRGWCLALPSEGRFVIVSSIVDARGTISTTTTKDEGQFSTSQKERNGKARACPKGEDGKGQAQPKRGGGEGQAPPWRENGKARPCQKERRGPGPIQKGKEGEGGGDGRPYREGWGRPDPRVKEGKIGVLVVSFCAQSSFVTIVFFMILFFIIFCLNKLATIFPTHGVNYNVLSFNRTRSHNLLCAGPQEFQQIFFVHRS